MDEKEFNLIDEPWIRVRTPTLAVETVSLKEALLHAHTYVDLAGELPTQDVAVLRLLLAVLHTVFSRVDCSGNSTPIQKPGQALLRWKELWENKRLPEKPICDYLEQWHERFWLFHPERPFYQVHGLVGNTEGENEKLNGELSKSKETPRLFAPIAVSQVANMSYSDAARWLLYLNGYADIAVAPTKRKNLDVGWLGALGQVTAMGDTLFETLLLNLVLLKNGRELWGRNKPVWEWDVVRDEDRRCISPPDNQAELLTLQSRRILLRRSNGFVTGYTLSGGDYFEKQNAFVEQMTLWTKTKKGDFLPLQPERGLQLWREFASLAGLGETTRRPGVVDWSMTVSTVAKNERKASFRVSCLYYDGKRSKVEDLFDDRIVFHSAILSETGRNWTKMIQLEVNRCDELAKAIGELAGDLEKAAGHVEQDSKGNVVPSRAMDCAKKARELYYHKIDVPFREWLRKLDPAQTDVERDGLRDEWIGTARRLALDMGRELVENAGDAAMLGRFVEEKIKGNKDKRHYSAPKASIAFKDSVNRICNKEG